MVGSKEKEWGKLPKCTRWRDASASKDIVIIVVGETGVGISTFVKCLLDDDDQTVEVREVDDANLDSCTRNLRPVHIKNTGVEIPAGKRLVMVDTPGFNNSNAELPDLKILAYIKKWLKLSYKDGLKPLGVIYLHDITQPRVTNYHASVLFNGLKALCTNSANGAVFLATTKWPGEVQGVASAQQREDQLHGNFWEEMLKKGAGTGHFENTKDSASRIVEMVVKRVLDGANAPEVPQSRRCVIC